MLYLDYENYPLLPSDLIQYPIVSDPYPINAFHSVNLNPVAWIQVLLEF